VFLVGIVLLVGSTDGVQVSYDLPPVLCPGLNSMVDNLRASEYHRCIRTLQSGMVVSPHHIVFLANIYWRRLDGNSKEIDNKKTTRQK